MRNWEYPPSVHKSTSCVCRVILFMAVYVDLKPRLADLCSSNDLSSATDHDDAWIKRQNTPPSFTHFNNSLYKCLL